MTGMERPNNPFLSKSQLRAAGALLTALPPTACTSLSTRAHFIFHAQWARKENTLSLLTKHRQVAKSVSLLIRAPEQLAAELAGNAGCSAPMLRDAPGQGSQGTAGGGTEGFVSPLVLRDWRDEGSFYGRIPIFGRDCARDQSHLPKRQPITPCCDGSEV